MFCFLSSADFFKIIFFFEKLFQEYHQSVKQFGSRSGPTFWPDLVPNSLQTLSADDSSVLGDKHSDLIQTNILKLKLHTLTKYFARNDES